jgi:hypothetical protein
MDEESPRATLILTGSMIDNILAYKLAERMPGINQDESERIFGPEGPLGSFSNRIRLAHALGIIGRPLKRRLEMIKEMRNTAAHAHARLDFTNPVIVSAVASLFDKSSNDFPSQNPVGIRFYYRQAVISVLSGIADEKEPNWSSVWLATENIVKQWITQSPP